MNEQLIIGWCGPTSGYWQWTLEHFSDVRILGNNELANWLRVEQPTAGVSRVLFTAIDSRSDVRLGAIESVAKLAVGEASESSASSSVLLSSCCVLLGPDWTGHRRTLPLSDNLRAHYWYELHDRTLPWLMQIKASQTKKSRSSKSTASAASGSKDTRRLNPRVVRMLSDLDDSKSLAQAAGAPLSDALVITDSVPVRHAWVETLAGLGVQTTATTPDNLKLWAAPEMVVVDLADAPLSVSGAHQSTEQLLRRLVQQFPNAMIVVSMAFPRWDSWQRFRDAGADTLISKPGNVVGLLSTWQQWSQSARSTVA